MLAHAIASALKRQTYRKKRFSLPFMTEPVPTTGSAPTSVNLRRLLQRVLQLLQREVLGARDLQDRRLAATAQIASVGQLGGELIGDHDGAVAVGMDEIVRLHRHAGDPH